MQKISILYLLILGAILISCGTGNTDVPKRSDKSSKVQNETVSEPENTTRNAEPIRWYAGDEPTDLEKLQLLKKFNSGEVKFDFYAVFTEPFWSFYFFGNEVLFNAAEFDVPEVWTLEYPFADKENEQALSFMRNGEFWQLKVKKESGSDGMSDIAYPYSVKLDLMEEGGGTSLMKE